MTISDRPPLSIRPAGSPELRAHQTWQGFVQPVGLLVSLPALEKAQCYVNRNVAREQAALRALLSPKDKTGDPTPDARVTDFRAFTREVLAWEDTDLVTPSEELEEPLPEYGETLRATFAVPDPNEAGRFLALVFVQTGRFDETRTDVGWQATPQARIERLLRKTGIGIGVLFNGAQLRLIYAPRGESSGHATFEMMQMAEAMGRPILGALHMLLSAERLFTLPESQRLLSILKESRKYQNEVSTKLSEQVLAALHELVRGFQAANDARRGTLLLEVVRDEPAHIYGGLLTTLLRLVFILYAEDRGLLPQDPVYQRNYSVSALFEKLREDAARFPDTMDQRFGAWSRVLTLFRMIFAGARHGSGVRLPSRSGRLFDPDAYPFLEGRPRGPAWQPNEKLDAPKVSDGVLYRVLQNLLLLGGDRLSYRALDVEQIGSVYEAMMGFTIEQVKEPSIGLRAKRKPGAPPADPVVGLETLLSKTGGDRIKMLDELDVDVTARAAAPVKEAKTLDALIAALGSKVSPFTPTVIPTGHIALQPTPERRRSGSHYTPRALTEPIVERTLRPLIDDLGPRPTPDKILDLKVCDPAMGSGAFLVAACRYLGDQLVASWQRHGMPAIPPDEDPILHARRVVAQRCLYGVDKNPFAVDLAKLSLWLVTLAREHPFTFLDHSLRHGDSLVGLSREQIASFHWAPTSQVPLLRKTIDEAVRRVAELRRAILALAESDDTAEKERLLRDAEEALRVARRVGNSVLEAFFSGSNARERNAKLGVFRSAVERQGLDGLPDTPTADALTPFHWEIEFPEVFDEKRAARAPS